MSPDLLHRLLIPQRRPTLETAPPGLYRYDLQGPGEPTRFHLRVDPGGAGVLIADASAMATLSHSGVTIAKALLEGMPEADLLAGLSRSYEGAAEDRLRADVALIRQLLQDLQLPGDAYPVANLEDPAATHHQPRLMPPVEATIPLVEPARLNPILDRLWAAGIPHAGLLVPEQPDAGHLLQAVKYAQQVGLVCGVIGRASDLMRDDLLPALVQAGVDHVTAYYAAADPEVHDALLGAGDHEAARQLFADTQALEVADVAHLPLVPQTLDGIGDTLESLVALQVPTVRLFAIATAEAGDDSAVAAAALRQVAAEVEDLAAAVQLRYLWEPPQQRDPGQSLGDQIRRGPRCTSDVAIRVEADGLVVPPRGPYRVAGNLLAEAWQTIWDREAFRSYRSRIERPTRCDVCPGLAICAADCPREPAGWAQPAPAR